MLFILITVTTELHYIQRMLQAHMAAGENTLLRSNIDDIRMSDAVQRVMAKETGQIGKQFHRGSGDLCPPEKGCQEEPGFPGVHPAAAAFPAVPGLVHEPNVGTEQRKSIRFGKQIFPNFLRQGGQNFPAEGRVNRHIRHRSHLFFLGANYPFSITIFAQTDKDNCPERICDI